MKKIIFAALLIVYGCLNTTFADSNCLDFTDGNICFSLQNLGNSNYKLKKSFSPKTTKKMYMLNCRILTPDNKLKELGTCDKEFSYNGSGIKNIRIYVRLENEKKTINTQFNFGGFTSSQLELIKKFYKNWGKIKSSLISKYPKLKDNSSWETRSTQVYNKIKDLYLGTSTEISTYSQFKTLIESYISYSKKLGK